MIRATVVVTAAVLTVGCGKAPSDLGGGSTGASRNEPMNMVTAAPDSLRNPDMTEFARQVDVNGDGKMSRAEWMAKGLPDSSFGGFERGRGYVTLADYQANPAPAGIDLNGDGKLTVDEFKAFDRRMSGRTKNGKGPPPPHP